MLTNTGTDANVTGDPIRADGWYGMTDGLHTVAMYTINLQGRVFLEASLATSPTDSDWFPILLNGLTAYIQFPQNPFAPTGTTGDTGVAGFTFTGNLLWLRVRLDRSYLLPPFPTQDDIALLGQLDRVLLNT
jgi:hypothetical protein